MTCARHIALLGAAVLLSGCHTAEERFTTKDDAFSMRQLSGWAIQRIKGAIVFQGPSARGLTETTIVVRSVPLENVRPHAREEQGLSRATASVLAGLPNSNVSTAKPTGHADLRGVRYELTFEAPGKDVRMARTQVALLGEKRLFHLMHTAPEGALQATAVLFDEAVASLREE